MLPAELPLYLLLYFQSESRVSQLEHDNLPVDEDEDLADTTLQLVFFDGEEAFVSWTDTDSIYGAR